MKPRSNDDIECRDTPIYPVVHGARVALKLSVVLWAGILFLFFR